MRAAVVVAADIDNKGIGSFGLNAVAALILVQENSCCQMSGNHSCQNQILGVCGFLSGQESMKQPDTNQLILKVCQIVRRIFQI